MFIISYFYGIQIYQLIPIELVCVKFFAPLELVAPLNCIHVEGFRL